MTLNIRVNGVDKLRRSLGAIRQDLQDTIQAAGEESGKLILSTEGMQRYPPASEANMPPPPYYERGRGMWISLTRNTGRSERLGTRWVIERVGRYGVSIGNGASYAPFVHGESQAWFHAPRGWRRLRDVAEERLDEIQRIYQAWVDRLIKRSA